MKILKKLYPVFLLILLAGAFFVTPSAGKFICGLTFVSCAVLMLFPKRKK